MCASVQLPFEQVQDYLGEPVEGDDVVEFRLLYSGRLLGASRNDTRARMKHEIRREFHPQLRQLWKTHPRISQIPTTAGKLALLKTVADIVIRCSLPVFHDEMDDHINCSSG
jgi:hypothetical protein